MNPKALCIADLGFGDCGKGRLVNDLTHLHSSTLNVRYTGGAQCAHNVVLPDGRHHCFQQFGSGSFSPNVRTYLGPMFLVEPYALITEEQELRKKGVTGLYDRLSIHPYTLITTPWHWLANRMREVARGNGRHGSCGRGIGETRSLALSGIALCVNHLSTPSAARMFLHTIRNHYLDTMTKLAVCDQTRAYYEEMQSETVEDNFDFYCNWLRLITGSGSNGEGMTRQPEIDSNVIFEGAQGVLLDETHGCAPYNTWTDTTFNNALALCRHWNLETEKIGVMRTYMTRHGYGPLPTESADVSYPDHNNSNEWQGVFRHGHLDLPLLRYACNLAKPDCLAVTHLDCVPEDWKVCTRYTNGSAFSSYPPALFSLEDWRPEYEMTDNSDPVKTIEDLLGYGSLQVRYTSDSPCSNGFAVRESAVEFKEGRNWLPVALAPAATA